MSEVLNDASQGIQPACFENGLKVLRVAGYDMHYALSLAVISTNFMATAGGDRNPEHNMARGRDAAVMNCGDSSPGGFIGEERVSESALNYLKTATTFSHLTVRRRRNIACCDQLSVVRNSRVRKPKPSAHKCMFSDHPVRHSMFPLTFSVAVQPGALQPAPSTFLPLAELKPNCVYIVRYQLYDGQDITNAPKHHCILQSVDTLFGKVTIIPIVTLGGRTPEEYWTERATLTKKPNDVYHQFEYLPFGPIGNKGTAIIECQPPTVKGFIHFPQSVIIDYATVTAAGKPRHPGSLKPPNQATRIPPWGLEYIRRARSKWGNMSEKSIVAGRWPKRLKRLTKKFSASTKKRIRLLRGTN